jgi:hypothetical protein
MHQESRRNNVTTKDWVVAAVFAIDGAVAAHNPARISLSAHAAETYHKIASLITRGTY